MKGKGAEERGGRGRVVELNVSTSEYSMGNLGTFPYSANYHIGIACLPNTLQSTYRYFDKDSLTAILTARLPLHLTTGHPDRCFSPTGKVTNNYQPSWLPSPTYFAILSPRMHS